MMEMGYKQQSLQDEGFENATENEVVGGNIIFYSDEACAPDNPDCAASISFDKYYSRPYRSSSNTLTDRFLTYRMYWDPNEIKLTVVDNGQEFEFYTGPFPLGADAEEFHLPFFFVINLAVGGNFTDALSNNQVTADFPAKNVGGLHSRIQMEWLWRSGYSNGDNCQCWTRYCQRRKW